MMKGKLKQLISILLISVLVLSMAAPGFAAAGHTLTINSETTGHTFELYQIFKGDVATDSNGEMNVLTNIDWGASVTNPSELIADLQADADLKSFFADVNTSASDHAQAVAVAAGLSSTMSETTASALADKIADLVEDNLSETPFKSVSGTGTSYQIENIEDGYYLIKDKDGSLDLSEYGKDTAAYTKYIIGIIGEDKTITAKADKPDIEKYIENPHTADPNDNDPDLEKTEEYSIGDDIVYHLESEVPKMDGYNHYWFMVQDELSDGLTFVGMATDGAAVTVGGKEVTKSDTGGDWTYTFTQDGQKLYFVFNNFLESYENYNDKSYVGEKIVIRYIVKLNENAKIGAEGNDNTVSLVYSNNPNIDYDGEPTPGETNPGTGQTSDKKTVTYTTKLKIYKYDSSSNEPISNVSFKLTGTGTQTVYTKKEEAEFKYDPADDGDYVLVNGNYVEYDSSYAGYQRYSRTVTSTSTNYFITTQPADASSSGEVVGVTGTQGELTFTGLGAGAYTLTETDAPTGYNMLTAPIEVVITYEDPTLLTAEPTGEELATWKYSYTLDGKVQEGTVSAKDGEFVISIANTSSALLPSTGGVGTIIFTVVGLCAMAGAVIFLYTKKRREDL